MAFLAAFHGTALDLAGLAGEILAAALDDAGGVAGPFAAGRAIFSGVLK
jgi:hypothetical protein